MQLSKLVHKKAHPVVPDIAESRLKCVAGCIHCPLVQQISPILMTLLDKRSSGDEIANVNFFYDYTARHVVQNTKKNLLRLAN